MLQLKPEPKSDEPYSFEELCLPHYDKMMRFACRLTYDDQARAADIVQDSMVKAMLAWKRWQPKGDPASFALAWLYRIVNNTFKKNLRTKRADERRFETRWRDLLQAVHPEVESPMLMSLEHKRAGFTDAVNVTHEVGTSPPDALTDSAIGDEVAAALDRLTPDHREVVMLHYVSNLGCEEIAVALDIPKNTVFTRLTRARQNLERMLRNYAKQQYRIGAVAAAL